MELETVRSLVGNGQLYNESRVTRGKVLRADIRTAEKGWTVPFTVEFFKHIINYPHSPISLAATRILLTPAGDNVSYT